MKARVLKLNSSTIILSLGLAALGWIGCASPEHANSLESPLAQPTPAATPISSGAVEEGTLITTFGEYRLGDTIVEANQSEGKLTVKHLTYKDYPGGGKSTSTSAMSTPPDDWPLHEGWFAYVQRSGIHVWLHNGAGGLLLVEREETPARNFTRIYGTNNFPTLIPPTVLNHLKEPLKSILQPD